MTVRVKTAEALRFMKDCLVGAGTEPDIAAQHAELLVQADRIGCSSEGLNQLEKCVRDIQSGAIQPNNKCSVVKETGSTALVDAKNCLGSTSSHFAMDIAIAKAKKTGIGWVVVRGANYNGMQGYWAKKAADVGYIGFACCNTPPMMVAPRSKKAAIGSNPVAIVAPARYGDMFYFDAATTVASIGRIEMVKHKNLKIPHGWALGPEGTVTTDPGLAIQAQKLLPLGSNEEHSSYKGFGLAGMVEIFSGLLAGSKYAHHIAPLGQKSSGPANLGHCFVAIDPQRFAPGFRDRVQDCIKEWRQLEPANTARPVIAPGDREKAVCSAVFWRRYVTYVNSQVDSAMALAHKLRVRPLVVSSDEVDV